MKTNSLSRVRRGTQAKRRLSPRAIDEIRLRNLRDRVITECGCVTIPEIIEQRLGVKSCFCYEHGEQKIVRLATGREVTQMILGIELPEPSANDVCPF